MLFTDKNFLNYTLNSDEEILKQNFQTNIKDNVFKTKYNSL